MGSGGVASPTDPIWMNQYREDEIRAIVNETTERRCCTAAHCHPASAIRRCTACGVRSIEHGTLIDDETAGFVAEAGNWIVPTVAISFGLKNNPARRVHYCARPPFAPERLREPDPERLRYKGIKPGTADRAAVLSSRC